MKGSKYFYMFTLHSGSDRSFLNYLVPLFKTNFCAKHLKWKWKWTWRMASHEHPFWQRGKTQLENGLIELPMNTHYTILLHHKVILIIANLVQSHFQELFQNNHICNILHIPKNNQLWFGNNWPLINRTWYKRKLWREPDMGILIPPT